MYLVFVPNQCRKFIKTLPEKYRNLAIQSLTELKFDPFLGAPLGRELIGRFSYRFGVYRIVYKIRKKDKVVEVLRINHRSKVYN